MTLQYFETLKSIGTSASTKYIFPMEFTSLLQDFMRVARRKNKEFIYQTDYAISVGCCLFGVD